jgi:hypothetical protein
MRYINTVLLVATLAAVLIGRECLHVGFAGATYFQPRVPAIVRAYRERYPGVLLSPHQW